MKMTARLTAVMRMTVRLPLLPISAMIAAGPVTYALIPGGAGVRATTSLTTWIESFASVEPGLPVRFSCTYVALPSALCAAPAVSRIAPEILDVPHMFWIVLQLTNQTIVVLVGIVAEGLLTLQDDHRRTVGISFVEVLTHARHRLERRCIGGIQRQ